MNIEIKFNYIVYSVLTSLFLGIFDNSFIKIALVDGSFYFADTLNFFNIGLSGYPLPWVMKSYFATKFNFIFLILNIMFFYILLELINRVEIEDDDENRSDLV